VAFGFSGFESYNTQVSQIRGNVTFLGTDVGELFTATAWRVTARTAGGDDTVQLSNCRGTVVHAGRGDDQVALVRPPYNACRPGSASRAYGGPGDDVLIGSAVADFLDGGPGHDRAAGRGQRDTCVSIEVRSSC
jgi:Ca2+-binding RTX toxin-like protein